MTNKRIMKISFFMIFIIMISVFIYVDKFEEDIGYCATPDFISICGNTLNESQTEGRKLFKILCASCHKLDKKLIGPALGNFQMDSISFFKHLTIKDTILKNFHKPLFSQLNSTNSNDIFEYLKN